VELDQGVNVRDLHAMCAFAHRSYRVLMFTRLTLADDQTRPSALVLRHLEDLFGEEPVPVTAMARLARQDHWFGVLPQHSDLSEEGLSLADQYRDLAPAVRAFLLALAVDRGHDTASASETLAAGRAGFVEIAQQGETQFTSDLHRVAVLAASTPADHRLASRVLLRHNALPDGGVIHQLFAGDEVGVSELVGAAHHFARVDRPSWAVHCLIHAADNATSPTVVARLAADASNLAAFDGDFRVAGQAIERYVGRSDTKLLVRETSASRALRHLLLENDPTAARTAIVTRLRAEELDEDAIGEALSVLALVNGISADPLAWEGFIEACTTVQSVIHPAVASIADTMMSLNEVSGPHVHPSAAADGRGWVQLAECMASVIHGFRDMRLGTFSPTTAMREPAKNRLVRVIEAAFLATMLAQNQHWSALDVAAAIVLDTTATVRSPLLQVSAESMLAVSEAFRGERESAKERVDRIHSEPSLRRSHRLRAVIDSVLVMIEGSKGNYDDALALLSTRQPDALNLTVGPYGPMELFDFVDYALMSHQYEEATLRVELSRDAMQLMRSDRADFVLAACDALLASRTDLLAVEELLGRSDTVPFLYEAARLRLTYAEQLRRNRRVNEARRHLVRVEMDLVSVDAGAWLDRVHRELRACTRETAAHFSALTVQEMRIAELAASGLSNKRIGAELFLSPRTVGGHLYKIFPKLGISTRAQLRDALTVNVDA
jgi:DNA-binding CsgD family transcriptional regulator